MFAKDGFRIMDSDAKRGFSGLSSLTSQGGREQTEDSSTLKAQDRSALTQSDLTPAIESSQSVNQQHLQSESKTKDIDATVVTVLSSLGLMAVLILWKYGWARESVIYLTLAGFIIALSAINLRTMRLPNALNLYGSISAVVLCMVFTPEQWLHSILGGLVGGGIWMIAGILGRIVFKKEMVGMGVLKTGAMIGFFIGPARSLGAFFFTFTLALAVLPFSKHLKQGLKIPLGPFLAAGALLVLLIGEQVWIWYCRLVFTNP